MPIKNLSIAAKMAISIICLQLITLYVTVGYLIYDSMFKEERAVTGVIADSQVELIRDAVTYDDKMKLKITRSPLVDKLLSEPTAWVVATDNLGQIVKLGNVPRIYNSLIPSMGEMSNSEIKSTLESKSLSMKIFNKKTNSSTIHVMVGGIASYKIADIFTSLASVISLKVFMPMGIATIIFIPLITRRILSSLSSAANDARHINESDRKARIREDGIPREIMPLVKAVNAALQRLSEGYDARDRFLSSAAHELRAPVAIIEARLSIIEQPEIRSILSYDVARLANLAESLLDLQRIGQGLSKFQAVDLKKMLRQVISDYSPMIISAGYDVEFISCNDSVCVMGDESSLSRAVINLLQNSVNYGGRKGVISVFLARQGVITIQDEGPGIALVERERIFEPFYRSAPQSYGTGLGLHLVREIVQQHHGVVTVGEGNKNGALFEIKLPILNV